MLHILFNYLHWPISPSCPSIFRLLDTRDMESVVSELRKDEEGKDGLKSVKGITGIQTDNMFCCRSIF